MYDTARLIALPTLPDTLDELWAVCTNLADGERSLTEQISDAVALGLPTDRLETDLGDARQRLTVAVEEYNRRTSRA